MVINVPASYIDLIFVSNIELFRIEKSIYDKYHHNITYGKFNFDIRLPRPNHRKIWDYKRADTEAIQRVISVFKWYMAFQNKDINEKIKILNGTLFSIFSNFFHNRISRFDYKNPVWMNKEITLFLKKRLKLTKKYYNDPTDHNKNLLVNTANKCTRHFGEKAKLFNSYFASQYTPLIHKSQLPSLELKSNKMLQKITFADDHINLIIKILKYKEIKLCGKSIALPLRLIFQPILNQKLLANLPCTNL